ncbi:S8 family peptidase [Stackebrandtia soli]|uniref:S8 family peptidase n=1 Tax=Stackebrandtia soli TaxID=1892856 RepID=UPI0039EB1767
MQSTDRHRRLGVVAASVLLVAAIAPGTATAGPELGTILGTDDPNALTGRYIVELADASVDATTVRALAADYDGTVTHTYDAGLRGFAATMDPEDARALAADPAVAAVYADATVGIEAVQPNPPSPGLDRIDELGHGLDGQYAYPDSAGQNTTVHVIDTGVRTSHSDFSVLGVPGSSRASHGWDFVDNDADASDCNGHGTHLAGTVAGTDHGVAKSARIVSVRVLGCAGSGTFSGVIAGLDWAVDDANGRGVALLAVGGGPNTVIDAAVVAAFNAGVAVVVPAGSSSSDACGFSPARVPEAFTIGVVDTATDRPASFGNYGPCIDIWAPGTGITSTWHTSDTAVQTLSGGSTASAHAAGALALYLGEFPGASAATAMGALVTNAVPAAGPTVPRLYMGFLN